MKVINTESYSKLSLSFFDEKEPSAGVLTNPRESVSNARRLGYSAGFSGGSRDNNPFFNDVFLKDFLIENGVPSSEMKDFYNSQDSYIFWWDQGWKDGNAQRKNRKQTGFLARLKSKITQK